MMAVDAWSTLREGLNLTVSYCGVIVQVLGFCLYVWTLNTFDDIYSVLPLLLIALTGILIYPAWCIEEGRREARKEREREKLEAWWDRARERRRRRRPPISYQAFNNPKDSGDEEEWYQRNQEHERTENSQAYQTAKKAFILWRHVQRERGFEGPFRTTPLSMLELQGEKGLEEFLRFAQDKHGNCKCGWDAGNLYETTYWNL